jgi:hypothetical protein
MAATLVASTVTSDDLQTIAGSKIYISATLPATEDQAGYEALTFTEIGGATDSPSTGISANNVTYDLLSEGFTSNRKGQKTYGTGTVNYAEVPVDAGQVIVQAAVVSNNNYAFAISDQNGNFKYLQGIVQSAPASGGTADTIQAITMTIQWNSATVFVAAP